MKMKSLQKPLLLLLAATSALAAPVVPPGVLLPRRETRILPRQQNISQPVSFETVETTQTYVVTPSLTSLILLLTSTSYLPSVFDVPRFLSTGLGRRTVKSARSRRPAE
jgi:hypothetical protein